MFIVAPRHITRCLLIKVNINFAAGYYQLTRHLWQIFHLKTIKACFIFSSSILQLLYWKVQFHYLCWLHSLHPFLYTLNIRWSYLNNAMTVCVYGRYRTASNSPHMASWILVNIGPGNVLSFSRHEAITWTSYKCQLKSKEQTPLTVLSKSAQEDKKMSPGKIQYFRSILRVLRWKIDIPCFCKWESFDTRLLAWRAACFTYLGNRCSPIKPPVLVNKDSFFFIVFV